MENEPSPAHPAAAEASVAAPFNPKRAEKHDSWTRAKMARFVEALADTGSVSTAAKCVGMSRQSAYRLRSRLTNQPFDIAWDDALEFGLQQVAHEAMDRALNGTVVPVFYKGEQVGERRVFNERAVLNLMSATGSIGGKAEDRKSTDRHWFALVRRIEHGPVVWTDDDASEDPRHPVRSVDRDDDDLDFPFEESEIEGELDADDGRFRGE